MNDSLRPHADVLDFAALAHAAKAVGDESQLLDAVGGKGLNLAIMAQAGLPVPAGFCIRSDAYRRAKLQAHAQSLALDDTLKGELAEAYHRLGSGPVAVRSSATMEDGSVASFAGVQETVLNVGDEIELEATVLRCWRSLDAPRAIAYRQQQRIEESQVAMAVVVQRMIPAEVAGVMFTRDPLDATGERALVESSFGLGEAIVSGAVTPDRFQLARATGELIERTIAEKKIMISSVGQQPVPQEKERAASLLPEQLRRLFELGKQIESLYGAPRDVEWAIADGEIYILQARPITASAHEREQLRQQEIAALKSLAEPSGTVWARYNLAESLPAPTPLTWTLVRRMMSGQGGLGKMYRLLGYDPDPALDDAGIQDLICGRPYVNLSREPKMFFRDFPYAHDFAAIKADPRKALYPTPTVDGKQATGRTWWRLPAILLKMIRSGGRVKRRMRSQVEHLRGTVFPQLANAVQKFRDEARLEQLTTGELVAHFQAFESYVHNEFASESLQPAMLAAVALAELEKGLTPALGSEQAKVAAQTPMMGVRPDREADVAGALRKLAAREITQRQFLADFGHRGAQEMELAAARWGESPEQLDAAIRGIAMPAADASSNHCSSELTWEAKWQRIASQAKLGKSQRQKLEKLLRHARTYLALRESSKHYFLLGYDVLRTILLELDRRFFLQQGIFYLEPAELESLADMSPGDAPNLAKLREIIQQRRQRRTLVLSLPVPQVLFSDDLAAIGRAAIPSGATELRGTPISLGEFTGVALVLTEPILPESFAQLGAAEKFVLVCPSTDPAWVPLFLRAGALVMEMGGTLSHGAIVARELGIPAVAGIADVQHRITTGTRLQVDGTTGTVRILE